MEIEFHPKADRDLAFWKKSGNKVVQKKIVELIDEIIKHPYTGIGKPEPLKYEFAGVWSRRINYEHRIIYDVVGDVVNIYSLRGHYEK